MSNDPPLSPTEKLRKNTISLLRAVLAPKAKTGIPLHVLCAEYEETTMSPLDFRKMGYGSLEQFLRDIPELCAVLRAPEGYLVVKGIASKEDAHIYRLVSGQKKSKKKGKPKRGLNFSQVKRKASQFNFGSRPSSYRPGAIVANRSSYGQQQPYGNNLFSQRPGYNAQRPNSLMGAKPNPFTSAKPNPFMGVPMISRINKNLVRERGFLRNEIAPRFQRQQQNYNGKTSTPESSMNKSNSFTNDNNNSNITNNQNTNSSAPKSYRKLSPQELSNLANNFKKLLMNYENGLFVTRLRSEYKKNFKEDLPENIKEILEDQFSSFIRVNKDNPQWEILHLKKESIDNRLNETPYKTPDQSIETINAKYSADLEITAVVKSNSNGIVRNVNLKSKSMTANINAPSPSHNFIIQSVSFPSKGERRQVYVCHLETLNRFFVQYADSKIEALVDTMQGYYEALTSPQKYTMDTPQVGDFCVSRFSKDRSWFRGRILSVKSQTNMINSSYRCNVFYVDYGNMEFVVSNELKQLTEEFSEMPMQAVLCELHDIFPADESKEWPENVINHLKKITDNQELTMIVHDKKENMLAVDLVDSNGNSLINHLCQNNMARKSTTPQSTSLQRSSSSLSAASSLESVDTPSSVISSVGTPSTQLSSTETSELSSLRRSLSLEPADIPVCWVEVPDVEYIDVCVTNIMSTKQLSFIMIGSDYSEKLDKLETSMNKYYDEENLAATESLEINDFYVAFCDDAWYRVKLLSITDSECEVLLLDYGKKAIVPFEDVKNLIKKFRHIPFQAISCTLADVPQSYDPEILQYLSNTTLSEPRIACIIKRPSKDSDDNNFVVELLDTSSEGEGDGYVNINKELIHKIEAENDLLPALPKVNEGQSQAYITHISSEGDFYLQIIGHGLERLEILMEDMTSHFKQRTIASEIISRPEVGMICCAKFHADGQWYRAQIIEVLESRSVEVEFIDYGNRAIIQNLHIRKPTAVSEKVKSLPFQAVKCKLNGLEKHDYNEAIYDKMKSFIETYPVEIVIVETVGKKNEAPLIDIFIPVENETSGELELVEFVEKFNQVLEKEKLENLENEKQTHEINNTNTALCSETANTTFENISIANDINLTTVIDQQRPSTINKIVNSMKNTTLSEWDVIPGDNSISEKLQTTEEVLKPEIRKTTSSTSTENNTNNNNSTSHIPSPTRSDSPGSVYSVTWGIPEMKIKDRFIEGVVQDSTDPYKFSFIPLSHWAGLEDLHLEMLDYYKNSSSPAGMSYAANDICAVFHDEHELWYRAIVHTVIEDQCVVKYPDFSGSLEVAFVKNIRPLKEEFKKLPFLAVRCKLADVEPMSRNNTWDENAATSFMNLVINETFIVELLADTSSIPYSVKLHGQNNLGERFTVNDILISKGLARRKK